MPKTNNRSNCSGRHAKNVRLEKKAKKTAPLSENKTVENVRKLDPNQK